MHYTTVGALLAALMALAPATGIKMLVGAKSHVSDCHAVVRQMTHDERASWWDAHVDAAAVTVVTIAEAPSDAWETVGDAVTALEQLDPDSPLAFTVGRGYKASPVGLLLPGDGTAYLFETTRAETTARR